MKPHISQLTQQSINRSMRHPIHIQSNILQLLSSKSNVFSKQRLHQRISLLCRICNLKHLILYSCLQHLNIFLFHNSLYLIFKFDKYITKQLHINLQNQQSIFHSKRNLIHILSNIQLLQSSKIDVFDKQKLLLRIFLQCIIYNQPKQLMKGERKLRFASF